MDKFKVGDKVGFRGNKLHIYTVIEVVDRAVIEGNPSGNCIEGKVYKLSSLSGYWTEDKLELFEEEVEKKTVKLYSWADLCDHEQLLMEKWRVANEMRNHNEKDVLQSLRHKYLETIKQAINELGTEVPADKANELGF